MVKMERRKNTFKCVGVDFSSRFIHQFLSLNILFFVIICVRVGKEAFEVFGSLRFLGRESFLNPLGFGEREKF